MNRKKELTSYEKNYKNLPFEDILREFRVNNVVDTLRNFEHSQFLEIGCGPFPLFNKIVDFDNMLVLEPSKEFYEIAKTQSKDNDKIKIINDSIENYTDKLQNYTFDFIVIGGFLHEISNPDIVLKSIRSLCSVNTVVYSFVPNANSFHRLLAFEMGLIESIYQKSEQDKLFEREKVYDMDEFNKLFTINGFNILKSGSYFIKPFSHGQMNKLLENGIIDKRVINGLEKMKKYMPNLGAELFNICKIDD
jgi:SAM-dependent methyltransferase